MKKNRRQCRLGTSEMAMIAMLAAAFALQPVAHAGDQPAISDSVGSDVGTGWNILQIPAAGFIPLTSAIGYDIAATGYMSPTGSILPAAFYAPVYLPSGAAIGFLNLYAYDPGANTIVAELQQHTGYGGNPQCPFTCPPLTPSLNVVITVSSIGNSGFQYVYSNELNPPHTVNNNTRHGGGGQYVVEVFLPSPNYAFKGVDLWWKRQIAPAPGAARYTDVPLGAQFFAEIEALAASGITLGCTATTFCPNANLTRAQMAAFLARALGLYFPY